jgi:hypothetical protein
VSTDRLAEPSGIAPSGDAVNAVAWAGIGFGVVAALLYVALFYMLSKLPATRNELAEIQTNAPALMRLLIVGGSACLLNGVSLILCLVGYLLPRRSRLEAVIGSVVSLLMFLAVFSVVVVSLVLTP